MWSIVCASEVANKNLREILPTIDVVGRQAVQPSTSRPLQHQRTIAYSHMPAAAGNVDCCHVVCQPVRRLRRAVILGCVSGQGESLGELLGLNAVSKTRRTGCTFPFLLLSSLQQLDAMPGIVLADLARS